MEDHASFTRRGLTGLDDLLQAVEDKRALEEDLRDASNHSRNIADKLHICKVVSPEFIKLGTCGQARTAL